MSWRQTVVANARWVLFFFSSPYYELNLFKLTFYAFRARCETAPSSSFPPSPPSAMESSSVVELCARAKSREVREFSLAELVRLSSLSGHWEVWVRSWFPQWLSGQPIRERLKWFE